MAVIDPGNSGQVKGRVGSGKYQCILQVDVPHFNEESETEKKLAISERQNIKLIYKSAMTRSQKT